MRASGVQSRHRNIFSKSAQSSEQFRNVNLGSCYLDGQPLRANESIIAFPFAEPRGSIAVVKNAAHAISDSAGVIALSSAINGHDINPFSNQIATASEDGSIGLFDVPNEGIPDGEQLSSPSISFVHEKRALGVFFHPFVNGLLASHDGSKTVKVWDVAGGASDASAWSSNPLSGLVTSIDFIGANNSVVYTKDNTLSIFDVRAGSDSVTSSKKVFDGAKGGRASHLGGKVDRILCVGFGKGNGRELKLFDQRDLSKPLFSKEFDNTSSSSPFISYDEDLSIVYIWGKGDGNIRVFEATGNSLIDATEFKSNVQQSGLVLMPKRSSCSVKDGRIGIFLKLTPKIIDVIQILVPRAGGNSFYDSEIWPDTWNGESLGESSAILGGGELSQRKLVSLEPK